MINKYIDRLGKVFINGLVTLLPITITFGLLSFSFSLLKSWLAPLARIDIPFVTIPHAEIVLIVVVVFLAGLFLKTLIARSLVEVFEKIIDKMPIVSPIYTGIKQLVHAFSPSDNVSFKQVVLVEFPRQGVYSLGFLTAEITYSIANQQQPMYNVFVPTTPNPTTGFFLIITKDEFVPIDLTTQEAMALIISGGIIQPERFKKKL